MDENIIGLIIFFFSIVSGIAVIIPSLPAVIDKRGNGLRRFKKHGLLFFIAMIFLILMPTAQYYVQKSIDKGKDRAQKKEQDNRDEKLRLAYNTSIVEMKSKFDESNQKTVAIVSDNLGKYGYRFDSATGRLEKLVRDSSKTRVKENDDPVFSLGLLPNVKPVIITGKNGGNLHLTLNYNSADAGSTGFEINNTMLGLEGFDNYIYLYSGTVLGDNVNLSKNSFIPVYYTIKDINFKNIYIWIRGNYKNIDKSKSFNTDVMYVYNIKDSTCGIVTMELVKQDIIKQINKFEKRH